jgi:hypothetical protein
VQWLLSLPPVVNSCFAQGIYVRNITTGKVKTVMGQTYMLSESEELCEKELPSQASLVMVVTICRVLHQLGL